MKRKISRGMQLFRVGEWLFSKVPFMFIPLFLGALENHGPRGIGMGGACASYFCYLVFFYSFGYAVNDFSDRDIDKLVGKTNIMAELRRAQCIGILFCLVLGCVPLALVRLNFVGPVMLAFVYFFGAAYSLKPLRFKERGVAGLLVSALAQRTIPLLPLVNLSAGFWKPVTLLGGLGFLVGMRYILIHQSLDQDNDRQSGTRTFVGKNGRRVKALIRVCFVLECIVLTGVCVRYLGLAVSAVLLLVYIAQSLLTSYTMRSFYRKSYFFSFVCVPLEDVYSFYLPLILLLRLLQTSLWWSLPAFLLLLIGVKPMLQKWKTAVFAITHRRRSSDG